MSSLGGKWLELLHEVVPAASRVGLLFNRAASPGGGAYYMEPFKSAAASFGLTTEPLEVTNEAATDTVIAAFAAAGGGGVVAESDSFLQVHRDRIIAAVNGQRLPAIYPTRFFTGAGGLLSYGVDPEEQWQAAADYVDRILRGENPRDLAVQQPTKFLLAVNLKTAETIGVTIPTSIIVRADEVIE